jgi:hypothetical protein
MSFAMVVTSSSGSWSRSTGRVDDAAGGAGLSPAPGNSGRITGNHHRPRRYDRRLLRVFYLSGLSTLKSSRLRHHLWSPDGLECGPRLQGSCEQN